MTIHHQTDDVTVLHADCLNVLRDMPDNSIDSVVCDPPYALSFMGSKWDSFGGRTMSDETRATQLSSGAGWTAKPYAASGKPAKPAPGEMRAFQQWCELWAAETLRILKPGGHLLAFGGTRTWHRLTCAIEDAGFEVRDSIAWLYGCLSDDTEILTSDGWVRYDKATTEQHALAFNTDTGAVEWQQIQHVHRYWHDGEMVRLTSDHTDQLLTPNHRVVIEDGTATNIPYISSGEDLRGLLADLPSPQPLPVDAKQDLLEGVRELVSVGASTAHGQTAGGTQGPDGGVRDLRQGGLATQRMGQRPSGDVLFAEVQRSSARRSVEGTRQQGALGLDRRESSLSQGQDDRSEQPRLEGRRYRVQEARELCRSQVRASAGVGEVDGPQRRLHHGTPPTDGGHVRLPADPRRSGEPREPQPTRQPPREPDTLALEPDPQALRVGQDARRNLLPSTTAEASWVDYAGVVWCITVPHGAFIARRNGLIFATGNSGFPKSLDVGKAIDKAAGAVRPVTEQRDYRTAASSFGANGTMDGGPAAALYDVTAPATDAARHWHGWGTALKPAHEPIVVARKPLDGTVAQSVLKWGTGALNVDACRIAGADAPEGRLRHGGGSAVSGSMSGPLNPDVRPPSPAGRWPANVVLDEDQAAALDQQTGELHSQDPRTRGRNNTSRPGGMFGEPSVYAGYGDSGGASRFFLTAASDPLPIDTLQERFLYTAKAPKSERPSYTAEDGTVVSHPTVKPLAICGWLVRLVTPPGGKVLDLFAGSGAIVEAGLLEGFAVVGIEREAEYLPLIMQRIRRVDAARAAALLLPAPEPSLFDDDEPPPAARAGRWPANVVLDRSQAEALDLQSGTLHSQGGSRGASGTGWGMEAQAHIKPGYGDVGGASRFFLTVDPDDEGDAA